VTKKEIAFDNGNRAVVVIASRDTDAHSILKALNLAPAHVLVMVFGGTARLDDSRKARLAELFSDAIAPTAAELGALIIDSGTQSGVMTLVGEAFAANPGTCQLLGVAPKGKITHPEISGASAVLDGALLEPNHSHFVLMESNRWGGETATMLELARAFKVPTVAILVNGGAIAADEALQSVRSGWPLLLIKGSGRFADELSAVIRDPRLAKSAEVSEIARSDRIASFPIGDPLVALKNQLHRMLG
jgi:hypothetical protein